MRLLTFSVLRNCKLKALFYQTARKLSNDAVRPAAELDRASSPAPEAESNLIEFAETWPAHEQASLRTQVTRDMRVLADFVSEQEEQALMHELEPVFKRMRYEYDHWDNAIHGFRETERSGWKSAEAAAVMRRVLEVAFSAPDSGQPLPHQHVLDLAPAGHIKPHVDAVRFCGEVIAGICLLSDAVMRLQHERHAHLTLHAYLPRRCIYIMRGTARYEFSHAVEGNQESLWKGRKIIKRRRVAVITRSRPPPVDPTTEGSNPPSPALAGEGGKSDTARYEFLHAVQGKQSLWKCRKIIKRRRVAGFTRHRPPPVDPTLPRGVVPPAPALAGEGSKRH